jgi:tRNA A-37 threonylcarbamoyl transferase component Bud32
MTEIPPGLNAALAERYDLTRTIGRGGMATVYLARDLKHGRDVAVKVLRPDLAASIGTERFLVEIEIAARLHHPHIVPLFDSGEADGFLYYAMPFVNGESLRGLLNRVGRLDVPAAVAIVRQVADALHYAHRTGVLHRDIKPENILLEESHAFVTDFGIAKAVSAAGGANLTRSGFPLGTVGYMSPEQAAGVRTLDVRTDVYSLGCVLYELLVGETPGLWITTEAVRLGRFVDAEPSHRVKLDALPGRIEQVLARALAMRPTDRFPSMVGFADALVVASEQGTSFTDDELRKVVGRAAELDAARPTEEGAFSIGSVEQIAAQVGIPPERVREALAELEPRVEPAVEAPPRYPLVRRAPKGPIRAERAVAGKLSERQCATLVEHTRNKVGLLGEVSWIDDTMVWRSVAEGRAGRDMRLMIRRSEGRTQIVLEELIREVPLRILGGAAGLFVGALCGVAFGGLVGAPEFFAFAVGTGGAIFLSQSFFVNTVAQREQELGELADRLVVAAGTRE